LSTKFGEAYVFMVDLLDKSEGEMTLAEAMEIAVETYDLTLAEEHELMMTYYRERC
jgi:hypothetical protein